MATDLNSRRRVRRTALFTGLVLALTAVVAAPVLASAGEEQQGARLLQSVQAGKTSCTQLSSNQSELIGEYVMGRMLGSTATHKAMNQQMTSMMGSSGEAQAHTFMGRRFGGCDTGSSPAAFSTMMGMMGGYASKGTMTGNAQSGNGSGSGMMGGSGVRGSGDNGWSGTDTAMVVLMGLLLAAVVGALAMWHPWRRSQVQTPLDLLGERYANGEIEGEEYQRRRQALAGLT